MTVNKTWRKQLPPQEKSIIWKMLTAFGAQAGADRDFVEIDRLRSGKASVLSITPFVGLQTACHARLLDSHGPISSGRDLISRALQPRFYMSRIRSL